MFSQKFIAEHSLCMVFADASDWISMISSCSPVPKGRRDGLTGNVFVMYAQKFYGWKVMHRFGFELFQMTIFTQFFSRLSWKRG